MFDEFLSVPADLNGKTVINRSEVEIKDHSDRFKLSVDARKSFNRQYAQIYFARLTLMFPVVREKVAARWPGLKLAKILEVKEGEECAVIGTLYKDMKLKPSILDEYVKDPSTRVLTGNTKFVQDADVLIMEDEGARMTLKGAGIDTGSLATGMVIAVRGVDGGKGEFLVTDICWLDLPPARPRGAAASAAAPDGDQYVALVSGLGIGSDADPLPFHTLVDYLTGLAGSAGEQRDVVGKVVGCIIAGNLLEGMDAGSGAGGGTTGPKRAQGVNMAPLRELDVALTQLASSVPTVLMPGSADPTNYVLPQQPLHRCLLPAGASYTASLLRAPNPSDVDIAGVSFVGTSGQNLDDFWRSTTGENRLDMLESMLRSRHMAPTAPDTLAAYPFFDNDPFFLRECPDVLFAGNQPSFGARLVKGGEGQRCLLLTVPKFKAGGEAVLVNLRTLEATTLQFKSALMG